MLLSELFSRQLYHITLRSNIESIKRNGLIPKKSTWAMIEYNKPSVFLFAGNDSHSLDEVLLMLLGKTHHLSDTDSWDDQDWQKFGQSFVLVTVDTSHLQVERDPNADDREWYFTTDPIPPSSIISITNIEGALK